jgi:hypothetical protein
MQWHISQQRWKYLKIEIWFFIVVYMLFPILTDIEFNYREKHNTALFLKDIEFREVYGLFKILAFGTYYLLVQQTLLKRKVFLFVVGAVVFLVADHFYSKLNDLIIIYSPIFSAQLKKDALESFNRTGVPSYGINYMILELMCVTGFAYFIKSIRQEEQMRQLKEQQLTSELSYLKAQLHPHFFFNTLNNIYALAVKQSADTAPVGAMLADMMRYILYEAEQPLVPLSKEIAFLTNYVNVEQIRYSKSAAIEFDVQLNEHDTYIQPLLLLPFVENAFKHGLQDETGNGFVKIIIFRDETELTLEVANSKPLVKRSRIGVGLQNVRKRLELLYPGKHQLDVTSNETFYQANLTLQTV